MSWRSTHPRVLSQRSRRTSIARNSTRAQSPPTSRHLFPGQSPRPSGRRREGNIGNAGRTRATRPRQTLAVRSVSQFLHPHPRAPLPRRLLPRTLPSHSWVPLPAVESAAVGARTVIEPSAATARAPPRLASHASDLFRFPTRVDLRLRRARVRARRRPAAAAAVRLPRRSCLGWSSGRRARIHRRSRRRRMRGGLSLRRASCPRATRPNTSLPSTRSPSVLGRDEGFAATRRRRSHPRRFSAWIYRTRVACRPAIRRRTHPPTVRACHVRARVDCSSPTRPCKIHRPGVSAFLRRASRRA